MGYPREVSFLKAAARPEQYPPEHLPEVVFLGRSNVGKSSLINVLVGRRGLARTSRTPGKTQLIHFYRVEGRFLFVDLPGYGYAQVPEKVRRRWRPMVEAYLSSRKTLRLVVFLLDLRRAPSPQDLQLKAWLDERAMPLHFALTKADKLARARSRSQVLRVSQALGVRPGELTLFSARTGEGRRELWGRIMRAVGQQGDSNEAAPFPLTE